MRTEYKRDMNHNYLILHGEGEVDTGSYQVRMLVGNVMPSLLKCRVQELDGKFSIYYDITSRHSLASVYEEKKLGIEDLKMIFGSFIQAMEEMGEYLLNPCQLLIAPEYMYLDVEKRQIFFCCYPGRTGDIHKEFLNLTEYALPKIDHGDRRAVKLGYGIYRKALEDSFHLEHIKEELYKNREEDPVSDSFSEREISPEEENPWEDKKAGQEEYAVEKAYGEILKNSDNFQNEKEGKKSRKTKERKQKTTQKKPGSLWKGILAYCIFGGIFVGIAAATVYGILPGVSVELILGIGTAGIGAGMLGYLLWKKVHDASKEKNTAMGENENKSTWEINGNMKGQEAESLRNVKQQEKCYTREKEILAKMPVENFGNHFCGEKSYGETVVLSAGAVQGPATLVSREPGELATIYLQEEITVIGKMETAADAVIDLPTVSRMHAKIRRRDGEYYLSDLNSRNGTAVNGRLLQSGEDYCLQEQDEVDFAQARYVFLK